jgi:hypothetical protein
MPCSSCQNQSLTSYDLKYVLNRFSKNGGRENLSLEVDKIIESYPSLKDSKKDILDKMSVFYCQGLLDGYVGNTNQCSTFPSNFSKNDIDSFIKELSKNAYCFGYNDGILNKEKDDERIYKKKREIIDFLYSKQFRDHLPTLGLDTSFDITQYPPITHDHIKRYISNEEKISPMVTPNTTIDPNITCNCVDATFLGDLECLYKNYDKVQDCIGPEGEFFCNQTFAICPAASNCVVSDSSCNPNIMAASCSCTTACAWGNHTGMVSGGTNCEDVAPYTVLIKPALYIDDKLVSPAVYAMILYSYYSPEAAGVNCNSIITYPNSAYPKACVFANCMRQQCIAPYDIETNTISSSSVTCTCLTVKSPSLPGVACASWVTINNQYLNNENDIPSGAFLDNGDSGSQTYLNCAGITIPTDYSNNGTCSNITPTPPAFICNK